MDAMEFLIAEIIDINHRCLSRSGILPDFCAVHYVEALSFSSIVILFFVLFLSMYEENEAISIIGLLLNTHRHTRTRTPTLLERFLVA